MWEVVESEEQFGVYVVTNGERFLTRFGFTVWDESCAAHFKYVWDAERFADDMNGGWCNGAE